MASGDFVVDTNDEAARWAAREAYDELTPQGRAELNRWLAADRRNRGAFLCARAALYAMEDAVFHGRPALASDNDNVAEDVLQPLARWVGRLAAAALAVAASIAVFAMLSFPLLHGDSAATEVVNLKDGSVATLREGARISIAMSDDARTITLLRGEASFDVAHDAARPFVVRSGDIFAQATGTVYSVGRTGVVGGTVAVAEGSVLVWARDGRDQAVLLQAGGKLTLDPGPRRPSSPTTSPTHPLPPPGVAQISLDNVSIAAAAARFNRISRVQIVIADASIGETRIVGLFNANDPKRFAEAAAAMTDATIIVKDQGRIIEVK